MSIVEAKYRRSASINRLLSVYAYGGSVAAVFLAGAFGVSLLDVSLTPTQQMLLIASAASAAVAGFSVSMLRYTRSLEAAHSELHSIKEFALVKSWSDFEVEMKRTLKILGSTDSRQSPRGMLEKLMREKILSPELMHRLHLALEVRNQLVHSNLPVPHDLLKMASESLREGIEVLEAAAVDGSPVVES